MIRKKEKGRLNAFGNNRLDYKQYFLSEEIKRKGVPVLFLTAITLT